MTPTKRRREAMARRAWSATPRNAITNPRRPRASAATPSGPDSPREEERETDDEESSGGGRRLHPGDRPDDRHLHRDPADEDEAGREGRLAPGAEAQADRDRGQRQRPADDRDQDEARHEVVCERASRE